MQVPVKLEIVCEIRCRRSEMTNNTLVKRRRRSTQKKYEHYSLLDQRQFWY